MLLSTFVAVAGVWLLFIAYGALPLTQAMVALLSLPPLHFVFGEVGNLRPPGVADSPSAAASAIIGLALLVVRAGLLSLWIAMAMRFFQGKRDRQWALATVGARALRAFPVVLGIEGLFLVLSFVGAAAAGVMGLLVALILLGLGMYLLILAPIVAVCEGARIVDAIAMSVRAARLPGSQQGLAVAAYLALSILVILLSPSARAQVPQATPSIVVWAYVLFVSFIHVGALAAFTYRWLAIREVLPARPPQPGLLASWRRG
jgi:hypothetical protein